MGVIQHDARAQALRSQILDLVGEYADLAHAGGPFVPGSTPVPVSGRVYDGDDMRSLVDSSLDFWLTTGRFNHEFERRLSRFLGVSHVLTTNSGSSANLLAVAALTSPALGERALRPGDEVITTAVSFPTTVNPILLYGLVPVFVDVDIPTYNANPRDIEAAITDKTRAVVLAHTLGNPFDVARIKALCERHQLWLIEDSCDALGSQFDSQRVGTAGDISTVSFYPAHHITMGEGGAVCTRTGNLRRLLLSFRDWGRDCFCAPGKDNTCGKRFEWQLGDLPAGYDHKYIYSHAGFNLKITDMQAAVGVAQLDKLEGFIAARKHNYAFLRHALQPLEEFFVLPEATAGSEPAWFGLPLTIRPSAPFSRNDLLRHLDRAAIGTRLLFAGNITRQPYFQGRTYRVAGTLENTDRVTNDSFWLGVYPGLAEPMLQYVGATLASFCRR